MTENNYVIKKNVLRFFWPWEEEKEQAWLEEMARQGWQLSDPTLLYAFRKAEPGEYVYRKDYFDKGKKEKEEYLSFFRDSGWECVCSSLDGWMYFRTPKKLFTTEIYTDPESRIDQLKRIQNSSLALFVVFLVLIDFNDLNFSAPIEYIPLVCSLLLLLFLIIIIVWMLRINQRIEALKKEMDYTGEKEKNNA